jgi:hypothetical protein
MKTLASLLVLTFLPAAAQNGALTPEWEVKKILEAITAQAQRLTPLLEQVRTQEWLAKGAPEAYVSQQKQVRDEIGYLVRQSSELSGNPSRMTLTLETFLRLQALEQMMDSLSRGIRAYQNPALGDLLQSVMSENSESRAKLRDYLVELIAAKEDELRIADQEAQRCRGVLIRQPKPAGAKP